MLPCADPLLYETVNSSRELPAEVLLAIFENLLPARPDSSNLASAYPDLLATCLCSKRFNQIASLALYRHVYFAGRAQVEMFLRTAGSARWTAGSMAGVMRKAVRGVHFSAFKTSKNETRLFEWVLSVVDPSAVRTLVVADLCVAMAAFAPLTGLRSLDLAESTLLLDETPGPDKPRSFPSVTHLRVGELARVRFCSPSDPLKDDPYDEDTDRFVDSDLAEFLCPEVFPVLRSLKLDECEPVHPELRADATSPSLNLLAQLTSFNTLTDRVKVDIHDPATWQALNNLTRLTLQQPPNTPLSTWQRALVVALEHLSGPLKVLDLSGWQGDGAGRRVGGLPRTGQTLKTALVEDWSAVARLRRVVLPGEWAWGAEEGDEEERAMEVGWVAETVRVAGKGRVMIEYA